MKNMYLTLLLAVFAISATFAQKSEVYNTKSGAVNGYDVVAYFKESKPVKGDARFKYQYKGADWLFSTKQNLDLFKAAPETYAPQFGGYCAYGCSQGHKAPTDPAAFTVVDGKLYLNYNGDVKKMWLKDQTALIKKAHENWEKIKDKE